MTLIVCNPVAGNGRAAARLREVRGDHDEVAFTQFRGHATDIARDAVRRGRTHVVVIGGDGTLHEVVQGIAGHACSVEFIPAGSSCDFARRLVEGEQLFDLIEIVCGGRSVFAVNAVNVGWIAAAAARVASPSRVLRLVGRVSAPAAVSIAAIAAAVTARPVSAKVTIDGAPLPVSAFANLMITKTEWISSGMRLAPELRPAEGRATAVTLTSLTPLSAARLIYAAFRGNAGASRPLLAQSCIAAEIETEGLTIEADGEIVGTTPAKISLRPAALRVVTRRVAPPTPPPAPTARRDPRESPPASETPAP